ncbi:hypothetical protein HGM15179_002949 [Zosterops borbonicus]|uniref:Uncharacterized protein n=1 Tax=Zosterops borbonicus TaxID=364589 RepID=A0A8K1GU19_9PASS|nr:hypothetical protein HGM15179_002949 [Zosterops borbonicus]
MLESFKFLYMFMKSDTMYFDNFDNLMITFSAPLFLIFSFHWFAINGIDSFLTVCQMDKKNANLIMTEVSKLMNKGKKNFESLFLWPRNSFIQCDKLFAISITKALQAASDKLSFMFLHPVNAKHILRLRNSQYILPYIIFLVCYLITGDM